VESGETVKLTPKAAQTRQRILDSAWELFAARGYEVTTMRDIAAAAGCSLGLTYRYFASKEDLALELYRWLVAQLDEQAGALPVGTIAERFRRLMRGLFVVMAPHRLTLGALFGAALNPRSRAGLFSEEGVEIRRQARAAYAQVVAEARDAPQPAQVEELATLLYGVQLALTLFWLQDRSEEARGTEELLNLVHDLLRRARPLLRLPLVARTLARLVQIVGPMLGQDGHVLGAAQPPTQGDEVE
jgi:AcrR family transcriptional regulator